MTKKYYNEEYIQNIADAIRVKKNTNKTYKVGEMSSAILSISGDGTSVVPEPAYQSKTVSASTSNDVVVRPDEGYSALEQVTINKIKTQAKRASADTKGVYVRPDEDYDGLSYVAINEVTSDIDENITPENIKKDIEILGVTGNVVELHSAPITYTPSINGGEINPLPTFNAISKVTLNPVELNLQNKTVIPTNSEQIITKDANYDALGQVTVEAMPNNLQDLTINANGVYQAATGYSGLGTVTVDVAKEGATLISYYTRIEEEW